MQDKDIIKLILYVSLIVIWFVLFLADYKKNKNYAKTTEKGNILKGYFQNLMTRWYDILFLVGLSGVIILLKFNITFSVIIGISVVLLQKAIAYKLMK